MPSPQAQPPKSSAVDTLPDDLKDIANRLINEKFGVKKQPEPEVLGPNPFTGPGSTWGMGTQSIRRIRFELRPLRPINFRVYQRSSGTIPRFFDIVVNEGEDYRYVMDDQLKRLEHEWGVEFQARMVSA